MGTFLRDVMLFRQVIGWGIDYCNETIGPPNSHIKAIAAGGVESIALKKDGSIISWGGHEYSDSPGIECPYGKGFKAISTKDSFHLALKADGSIAQWGNRSFCDAFPPPAGTDFIAISAGYAFGLALKTPDSEIVEYELTGDGINPDCTGEYEENGTYNGVPAYKKTSGTEYLIWVGGGGWRYISVAKGYSAGIFWAKLGDVEGTYDPHNGAAGHPVFAINSSIIGWGTNDNNQITGIPSGTDFTAIAAGEAHGIALKKDGSLVGWGANGDGQADCPAGNDFVAITAGYRHSLALRTDGSIVGWGTNSDGEITIPEPNSDFIAIAAGDRKSVGLKKNGSIVAWGLGEGATQIINPSGTGHTKITSGIGYNFAIKSDGSIIGWGIDKDGQANYPSGTDFVAVAAGGMHGLALKSDGSIVGWGSNNYRQASCPSGTDFKYISAGYRHSIALKTDDSTIVGWGDNSVGQLDNIPPPSDTLGPIIYDTISAGRYHNLTIHHHVNDPDVSPMGHIVGWGDNDCGQVSPCPSGNNFVSVSAGGAHSLALKSDGHIVAWGDNTYGQINCPSGAGYTKISAGRRCSLAIAADGSIEGWGDDSNGQKSDIPELDENNIFVDISAGGNNCTARKADGTIVTWGYAGYTGTTYPKGNNFKAVTTGTYHCLALKSVVSVKDVFYDPVKKKQLVIRCAKCIPSDDSISITFSGIIHKDGASEWPSDPNRTFIVPKSDPEYFGECEGIWVWRLWAGSPEYEDWTLFFHYANHLVECWDDLIYPYRRAHGGGELILKVGPASDILAFATMSALTQDPESHIRHSPSGQPTIDICSGRKQLNTGGRFRDRITTIIGNQLKESDTALTWGGVSEINSYGGKAIIEGGGLFADGPGFC